MKAKGLLWAGNAIVMLQAALILIGSLNAPSHKLPPTWIALIIVVLLGVVLMLVNRRKTAILFIVLSIVIWIPSIITFVAELSRLSRPDSTDIMIGVVMLIVPTAIAMVLYIIGAVKNMRAPGQNQQ